MNRSYLHRLIVACIFGAGLTWTAYGQDVHNGTNLFIADGLELHVNGSMNNTGFVRNQGSVFVDGNWINTNVYQGLGTITLQGNSVQRFNNNSNGVHHMVIDGAGRKRIENRLPITQSLDLLNGIVEVKDSDTLLVRNGASVNGGNSASFVDGALTHEGTGYKFFPIGINAQYHPLEFLDVTGVNPVTEVEVHANGSAEFALPANGELFSTVHWQQKTIRGAFTGSPLSLGYDVPDGYTNRNILDIFQGESLSASFTALGSTTVDYSTGIDKIASPTPATGSLFVIGEVDIPGGVTGQFYFSTTLSPEASDPDNRAVKIFGNQLAPENFLFVAYNRWGLKVYESKSLDQMINIGWDGQQEAGGTDLPSGVYPYVFRATRKTGESIEQKGVITIVR